MGAQIFLTLLTGCSTQYPRLRNKTIFMVVNPISWFWTIRQLFSLYHSDQFTMVLIVFSECEPFSCIKLFSTTVGELHIVHIFCLLGGGGSLWVPGGVHGSQLAVPIDSSDILAFYSILSLWSWILFHGRRRISLGKFYRLIYVFVYLDFFGILWPHYDGPTWGIGLLRRTDSHDERRPMDAPGTRRSSWVRFPARPSSQKCNCTKKCVVNPIVKKIKKDTNKVDTISWSMYTVVWGLSKRFSLEME